MMTHMKGVHRAWTFLLLKEALHSVLHFSTFL
jgi:hypothetical protein